MAWIYLPQDRDKWQDLLNMVMHVGFLQSGEVSWLAEEILVPQEGLFLELVKWLVSSFVSQQLDFQSSVFLFAKCCVLPFHPPSFMVLSACHAAPNFLVLFLYWYQLDTQFFYINYIKLSSSTCFELHPFIFRRSMMLIVHVCSLWYSHSLQVAVLCTC